MNETNIAADLNLLRVFRALIRHKNVSRASRDLGLSQPATSHALARLRETFGDGLFARTPRGMVPTPRALELAPQVEAVLRQVEALFRSDTFAPASAQGKVAVASTEFLEMTVFGRAFEALRKAAPGVVFQMRNVHGELPKTQMERGEFDIAIAGYFGQLPEGFYQQKLFENDFVVVCRKRHPGVGKKLTLAAYLELDHLLISPQGDSWGLIDELLKRQDKSRRVVAGFENYLTPGAYVASSLCVATVPRYLGQLYERTFGVQLHPLPLPSPEIAVVQVWHERTHTSPLHRYVRNALAEAARQMPRGKN